LIFDENYLRNEWEEISPPLRKGIPLISFVGPSKISHGCIQGILIEVEG
jgi:hypothetical protein